MDEGVMYTNAHHEHALTNTAPGHASIATGKYPSNNGIINNSFYSKEIHAEQYCVDSTANLFHSSFHKATSEITEERHLQFLFSIALFLLPVEKIRLRR